MNVFERTACGLGCYMFDMFVGCVMYADDIILLSGSMNDVQSMLNVCDNVSSQLLLKFITNKCKCIAFGKMTMSAMSGDGLRLDKGVVMWLDTIEYLGIHFTCGKRLQVDIDPIRRRFYAANNSILMNASHQDQLLQLHLQCYCFSLLTYCHGALSFSKAQLSNLNVCWNNLCRKLFTAAMQCKRCTSYGNSVRLSVRLTVCLSVTRRNCVKTTARSTMQFALSDSKMCLVL